MNTMYGGNEVKISYRSAIKNIALQSFTAVYDTHVCYIEVRNKHDWIEMIDKEFIHQSVAQRLLDRPRHRQTYTRKTRVYLDTRLVHGPEELKLAGKGMGCGSTPKRNARWRGKEDEVILTEPARTSWVKHLRIDETERVPSEQRANGRQ